MDIMFNRHKGCRDSLTVELLCEIWIWIHILPVASYSFLCCKNDYELDGIRFNLIVQMNLKTAEKEYGKDKATRKVVEIYTAWIQIGFHGLQRIIFSIQYVRTPKYWTIVSSIYINFSLYTINCEYGKNYDYDFINGDIFWKTPSLLEIWN